MNQLTALNPTDSEFARAARKALSRTIEDAIQETLLKDFATTAVVNGLSVTGDFTESLRGAMAGWVARVEFQADGCCLTVETPEDRSHDETGCGA